MTGAGSISIRTASGSPSSLSTLLRHRHVMLSSPRWRDEVDRPHARRAGGYGRTRKRADRGHGLPRGPVIRRLPSLLVRLGVRLGGALLARLLGPALGRRRRGQGLALGAPPSGGWDSPRLGRLRRNVVAFVRRRLPCPAQDRPALSRTELHDRRASDRRRATGCASERSRSALSSLGHGSGPERRNGSPGMSPTSSSNGSNPARPTTVCC